MTLCHTFPHLDSKMSVKNNKMLKGTTLSMTIFVYDEYQTFDPPDQFDDMFYTVNDYWNEDNDTGLLYDDDTIRQVDDELGEQEHRYVTHVQDGYTVE